MKVMHCQKCDQRMEYIYEAGKGYVYICPCGGVYLNTKPRKNHTSTIQFEASVLYPHPSLKMD